MKLYTLSSVASVAIVIACDRLLRTNLRSQKKFWYFQLIIVLLTTLVDSYSSGKPIVTFNPETITNIRVFSVPIENYLFGFSMTTLNLVLYEKFSIK